MVIFLSWDTWDHPRKTLVPLSSPSTLKEAWGIRMLVAWKPQLPTCLPHSWFLSLPPHLPRCSAASSVTHREWGWFGTSGSGWGTSCCIGSPWLPSDSLRPWLLLCPAPRPSHCPHSLRSSQHTLVSLCLMSQRTVKVLKIRWFFFSDTNNPCRFCNIWKTQKIIEQNKKLLLSHLTKLSEAFYFFPGYWNIIDIWHM